MKQKRSQISVEYMILIGFVIIMLCASMYVAIKFSSSSLEEVFKERLEEIGNIIAQNAREVYYLGLYSKVVVTVAFPEGVENMSTLQIGDPPDQENYLIFEYRTNDGSLAKMYTLSEVPLITPICYADVAQIAEKIPECATVSCYYCIFEPQEYDKGPKNFKLTHVLNPDLGRSVVGITSVSL